MNGALRLVGAILFITLELSFLSFALLYPILERDWWRKPVGRALEGIFVVMAISMGYFTLRAFVDVPGGPFTRVVLFALLNVASWGFTVLLIRFYRDRRRARRYAREQDPEED